MGRIQWRQLWLTKWSESVTLPPMGNEIFVSTTWRLIIDNEPRSGPANMAIDQAIAESCAAGISLPTLRFYRWHPPAVSLGRHQASSEINLEAAEENGYEIVRRTTGGRAILHVDELTYSVAAPKGEVRMSGTVMDAYLQISNALILGLEQLGAQADKAGGDVRAGRDVSAACFEVPSAYEIMVGGRKLLGSAQSRRAGYVLQHGSLPLEGDITRLINVLALADHEVSSLREQLSERACTLSQALNHQTSSDGQGVTQNISFNEVARALCDGFQEALNVVLEPNSLTMDEIKRSAILIREQFANPEWTNYK